MKGTRSAAVYYSSRKTVRSGQGVLQIERDGEGDYLIRDDDTTIYLGKAADATTFNEALDALLSENDEG